jgi:hypothetical protein
MDRGQDDHGGCPCAQIAPDRQGAEEPSRTRTIASGFRIEMPVPFEDETKRRRLLHPTPSLVDEPLPPEGAAELFVGAVGDPGGGAEDGGVLGVDADDGKAL